MSRTGDQNTFLHDGMPPPPPKRPKPANTEPSAATSFQTLMPNASADIVAAKPLIISIIDGHTRVAGAIRSAQIGIRAPYNTAIGTDSIARISRGLMDTDPQLLRGILATAVISEAVSEAPSESPLDAFLVPELTLPSIEEEPKRPEITLDDAVIMTLLGGVRHPKSRQYLKLAEQFIEETPSLSGPVLVPPSIPHDIREAWPLIMAIMKARLSITQAIDEAQQGIFKAFEAITEGSTISLDSINTVTSRDSDAPLGAIWAAAAVLGSQMHATIIPQHYVPGSEEVASNDGKKTYKLTFRDSITSIMFGGPNNPITERYLGLAAQCKGKADSFSLEPLLNPPSPTGFFIGEDGRITDSLLPPISEHTQAPAPLASPPATQATAPLPLPPSAVINAGLATAGGPLGSAALTPPQDKEPEGTTPETLRSVINGIRASMDGLNGKVCGPNFLKTIYNAMIKSHLETPEQLTFKATANTLRNTLSMFGFIRNPEHLTEKSVRKRIGDIMRDAGMVTPWAMRVWEIESRAVLQTSPWSSATLYSDLLYDPKADKNTDTPQHLNQLMQRYFHMTEPHVQELSSSFNISTGRLKHASHTSSTLEGIMHRYGFYRQPWSDRELGYKQQIQDAMKSFITELEQPKPKSASSRGNGAYNASASSSNGAASEWRQRTTAAASASGNFRL